MEVNRRGIAMTRTHAAWRLRALMLALLTVALVIPIAKAPTASADAGTGVPAAFLSDEWIEVRTDHFNVLTDAREGISVGVARRLEQLCAVLAIVNPDLRAIPALPIDVFIFKDQATLNAFRPGDIENVEGFAMAVRGRNLLVVDGEVEGTEKSQVVCHEFTHLYLGNNYATMPVWLNEGLAEYYGTFRPRGKTAEIGHRRDWMVQWIDQNQLVSLDLLFAMNTGAHAYTHDNSLRYATYTEGWALVHYLQAEPARAAHFEAFLDSLRGGGSALKSFQLQFPEQDWPQLVMSVRKYVSDGLIDPRSIPLESRLQSAPTTTRTVSTAEALSRLGQLLADLGPAHRGDAAACLHAALERDSTLAEAWSGTGLLMDADGDSTAAEIDYGRATSLAPDSRRVAMVCALGTLERWRIRAEKADVGDAAMRDALLSARQRFARCLQLDENNAEALAGFGLTYLAEGRMPDNAYRSLLFASAAMPGRTDVLECVRRARELRQESHEASAGH